MVKTNHTYKALDFSQDNDCRPDENGEFTKATFQIESLPSSFTICSALWLKHWANIWAQHFLPFFLLLASDTYTQSTVWLEDFALKIPTDFLFYPFQWTRFCLSKDSNA